VRVLALQRTVGNRAVGQLLSRDPVTETPPKIPSAADVASARDPLDFDAFPGWWWYGIGPALDAKPDEKRIREILVQESAVNAKILADSTAALITSPGSTPYYAFRHPTRGVVARALVAHPLGVARRVGGGPASPDAMPLKVFVFSRPRGGESLGTAAVGSDKASAERELKGLPPELVSALGGPKRVEKLKQVDPVQLLRIAEKLAALNEDELKLFEGLDKMLTDDLDLLERAVDDFIAQRDRLAKQTLAGAGERSLEDQLKDAWKGVGAKKWRGMDRGQREATARQIANAQTKTRLKYMVGHPGGTLKDMAKGIVRVDQLGKGVWKDIEEAANGDNNAWKRWAGGVGAGGKISGWLGAVAGILYLALLLIPGVNVAVLAQTAVVAGVTAIVLAKIESELRIQSAAEAKTYEGFHDESEAAGAAGANFWMGLAVMAFGFALKIIAKTPIPGRMKTVGGALKTARAALTSKAGVAFTAARASLLSELRTARQGMPALAADQLGAPVKLAGKIEGMTGAELVDKLANNDPAVAELEGATSDGQTMQELATEIQKLAATQAGESLPETFKQQVVDALKAAPGEAARQVSGMAADLDRTIAAVDQAGDPAALAKALDAAEERLAPDAQSAAADESTKQLAVELEEQAAAKQQAAQKTAAQELEQTIEELTTERQELNVKRGDLQAAEDALRKQRAAKQRELNGTREQAKRDRLTQEIERLDEQVADAEADRITKQQQIEDADIRILKARHPLDRVPQDLKVANRVADPPKPLAGRKVGSTPNQEAQLRADVDAAVKQGATDIRINEPQVDANGRMQGINRPDLQYTLGKRRIYIEYEQPSNPRGLGHATRVIPNDPTAKVIVKLVPKDPAFTPGQGVKQLVYTLDEVVKLVAAQP
jgi:hypothetical protein